MRRSIHVIAAALLAGLAAVRGDTPAPRGCWPGPPGTDPAACPPDDPGQSRHWEYRSDIPAAIDRSKMHPREVALGAIGMSLDRAWQLAQGRDDVLIAILDSGIRWDALDLVNKLYLNAGELPPPAGAASHDANGDGRLDVRDYASDDRVGDRNANGILDPQDLIRAFSDGDDDDGNGYVDDISGYDLFVAGGTTTSDNDPADDTDFGHGTGIAATAAAQTDNGLLDVGVCPRCRVLPVRVGDSFVVDANRFARGTVFAVRAGAKVIGSALGSYNNTPAARAAVDLAYASGVALIGSAADEFSYHHNFPSAYNHVLYVNAMRFNHVDRFDRASTFWGLNPCTNFGARVWVSVPALSCSSGATSRLAGLAGLVVSAARDAGQGDLAAEEVYQLLRATADDLDLSEPDFGPARWPATAGFDQYSGYGRVNALRAVEAARQGRIPPQADLTAPDWFAIVVPRRTPRLAVEGTLRFPRAQQVTWHVDYALGVEPAEADYVCVAGGTTHEPLAGKLAVLDFGSLPLPRGDPPARRAERDRYTVTVRLVATDERGLVAEARRSLFVLDDPSARPDFPLELGASGEAGPVLHDLDGDGDDEIVLPTADGLLRILSREPGGLRQVQVALGSGSPVDPIVAASGREPVALRRETVVRSAAIGDIAGRGKLAIVVASRDGQVHAFDVRGRPLPGFPVRLAALLGPASSERAIETGILSTPVLADLDGRPGAEIVVSALDGQLYAWRGDGSAVAGFPVALVDPARPEQRAKSVSTPAVGDIDGDGRVEIVLGSNGVNGSRGAVYAVRAHGRRDPRGPFVAGWQPYTVPALRPELLPTLATGVAMSPALVDADGDRDLEVVLYAVTGSEVLLVDQPRTGPPRIQQRFALVPHAASELQDMAFLAGTGSPLVADTDGDGEAELYAPLLSMRMVTLRSKPGVPLDVPLALGGWRIPGGPGPAPVPMLAGYPRRMEDLMLFASPAAADVDGDGRAEVLMGSGGYLLHAFRMNGGEAAGFPKFTGGWIFSRPAVGDLDGDGGRDLVVVTREGYLFAWTLSDRPAPPPARASGS